VSYVEGYWSPVPAPERRAFLSREGPISIRVFFKLGITYAVVVCIAFTDLEQQKGRPTGPPSSGVRTRSVLLSHEPPNEGKTIGLAPETHKRPGVTGERRERLQ
jgi:hypothetical protein